MSILFSNKKNQLMTNADKSPLKITKKICNFPLKRQ